MKSEKKKKGKKPEKQKIVVSKEDFIRAVNMIKAKDIKQGPLENKFNRKRRLTIINLCNHNTTIPNGRRQNVEVLPTNTQLLLSQLRKCISEHNWPAAARCVHYMLDMNGKLLPIIWKTVVLIMLNHPEITAHSLNEFLQMCLGLRIQQDKSKFLQQLLTLPEDLSIYSKKNINITATSDEEEYSLYEN